MNARIDASVREWTPRTCKPGYHGLRELADAEFTGAAAASGARLFMLNGRIVGLSGGTIEHFEDVDLEARDAPDPSLPLLFSMFDGDGTVEAEYYTGDTSIAEVNDTLSSGSFTGYVELSENVLSGDYYLVYYGGKSMSVAFVGAAERLITGDEALEKADDEVGIYKVVSVDVELVDLPAIPERSSDAADDEGGAREAETVAPGVVDPTGDDNPDATASDTVGGDGSATNIEPDDATADAETGTTDAPPDGATARTGIEDEPSNTTATGTEADEGVTGDSGSTASDATDPGNAKGESTPKQAAGSNDTTPEPGAGQTADGLAVETGDGSVDQNPRDGNSFDAEKRWQETYTIPSLDPKRASSPTQSSGTGAGGPSTRAEPTRTEATRTESKRTESTQSNTSGSESTLEAGGTSRSESPAAQQSEPASQSGRDETIEQLQEQLATAQTERDDAERARGRLQQTVRELRESVERLEAEASRSANDGAEGTAATGQTLSPDEALSGTNLFVRYSSKGKPTLSDAQSGEIDREAVDENLRLERHTHFDSSDVSVDGTQYSSFLEGTVEYQFVEWIVRDLLYEIQETGNDGALRDLFEAIMDIDRAEFGGDVSVRYTEDGEEHRELCSFDIVLRNPMGHPLVVANVNDSRDPATGDMLAELVNTASLVAGTSDSFGCAIFVTSSFFEPEALETAAEATSSGFFGSGTKESFVRVSRKQGYHLCLVESRDGAFYVNVPEL